MKKCDGSLLSHFFSSLSFRFFPLSQTLVLHISANILFFEGNMRNLLITLSVLLAFSLASCSKSSKQGGADNNNGNMVKELDTEQFVNLVGDYTGTEFKFVGQRPCIVDFYATWCGPCKALSPIIDEIAAEYDGKIDVYRVDIDKNEEISAAFGIQSVPTLIFIPVSGQPRSSVGLLPKETIKEAIALVFDIK